MLNTRITEYLIQRKNQGLYRKRTFSDYKYNFSSNDYLSLTTDSRIQEAYQQGFTKYPTGSGGSVVVSGYYPIHRELETTFADALGVDEALLFSSGYGANLSVAALLAEIGAPIFLDKACHASLYDGLHLANVKYVRFLSSQLSKLKTQLVNNSSPCSVITESIFSMSGSTTNLLSLSEICKNNSSALIVDEAHAFGVVGKDGLGLCKEDGLTQAEIPLRIIPLGKAYAGQGAIVAGQASWIDALLQVSKPNIYSTSMSPALAYGLLKTFPVICESFARRQKLAELIFYFQQAVKSSPLKWAVSKTPIQQLQLGCPYKALEYSRILLTRGIFCQAMRQPSVSKLQTGLRVILNFAHTTADIDYFLDNLHAIGKLNLL